ICSAGSLKKIMLPSASVMNIGVARRVANSRARMRTTLLCRLPSLTRAAYATGSVVSVSVVEAVVSTGDVELAGLLPRDSEALLDEHAFEHDEFLPYWAELWPSGVALASAVSRLVVHGLRVLELGCGLALPSITAARRGARVLATDWSAEAVALAEWNAR